MIFLLSRISSVPSTYGGTNWRRMVLPEMLEVPEEFNRILAMPVLVELDGETGAIRAVKVSKSEPEWSVNYKKGIVSLFQVKMESSLSSNMVSMPTLVFLEPQLSFWSNCSIRAGSSSKSLPFHD